MSRLAYINSVLSQAGEILPPDFLIIILGPTASGKTKLAVELASAKGGEIISADSRQVYRQMDIGTGKDLDAYGDIPYHLIDIRDPGDNYNADLFRQDFFRAYDDIVLRGKLPILCGGTGSYIQQLLESRPYAQIPKNKALQDMLYGLTKEELLARIQEIGTPADLHIDAQSHKRLVRSLEILLYLQEHPQPLPEQRTVHRYAIFGIDLPTETRRQYITARLADRLQQGLVKEVAGLIEQGVRPADLLFYGLEYKYTTLYLQGALRYEEFVSKLNTEIHRYAKRQMTYFRKMEKDGFHIHWLS